MADAVTRFRLNRSVSPRRIFVAAAHHARTTVDLVANTEIITATKSLQIATFSDGAYRDRTGDLRLAKLCLASRAHPVGAGIADETRDSVRSLAGIAGRYRVLPATACGMYAG
jgi:hypothetical protein